MHLYSRGKVENMVKIEKEWKISEQELIKHYIKWYTDYLLRWDLKDLEEDIKSLRGISKKEFSISTSQRIRFSWRDKLEDQVERFKELEKIGKSKNWKTTPWEFFISPLSGIPEVISDKDMKSQKLAIINNWIGRFWQDIVSTYIFGAFPASILLCSASIELMIKGIILRDNEDLFQKIKGRTGFNIKTLMKNYGNEFEIIETKLDKIIKNRGNIIAHGINILEEKAEKGELFEILTHKVDWHQKKPLTKTGGSEIIEFKNLAKNTLEHTIEVLDHLKGISLKTNY